jgi:glutathione synthase/RimK-type ligase-like ATP-grasp enzyme
MKNVLIIGSLHSGKKNNASEIATGLRADDINTQVIYWEDLVFGIATGAVHITQNGSDILEQKPDLVIAVGWYKNGKQSLYRDMAFSLALALKQAEVPFWNSEMVHQRSTSKLSTMVQLALAGISIPTTHFSWDVNKIIDTLQMPYVAKAASASRGEFNFLIKNRQDLDQVFAADVPFILQPFLENDHDLRVICFDGKPSLVLRRARQDISATHLNNTSQGGEATWIELDSVSPELLTLSEKICTIMGREMAGIDFIPDASSSSGYSCLEVNAVPQLTSGTDSNKKLMAFANAVRNI